MMRTILKMHFDRGPIWSFAHPNVEIFCLPRFKKHDIIAIVQLSKLVQLVQFRFRVQLSIFAAVGEE